MVRVQSRLPISMKPPEFWRLFVAPRPWTLTNDPPGRGCSFFIVWPLTRLFNGTHVTRCARDRAQSGLPIQTLTRHRMYSGKSPGIFREFLQKASPLCGAFSLGRGHSYALEAGVRMRYAAAKLSIVSPRRALLKQREKLKLRDQEWINSDYERERDDLYTTSVRKRAEKHSTVYSSNGWEAFAQRAKSFGTSAAPKLPLPVSHVKRT